MESIVTTPMQDNANPHPPVTISTMCKPFRVRSGWRSKRNVCIRPKRWDIFSNSGLIFFAFNSLLLIKMKIHCCILIPAVLLFVWGCTSSLPEKHSGISISVPLSKGDNSILLSNIVDSLHYIQLETTDECLIGDIMKIYFIGDKLVIFDKDQTKSIYFYKQDGTFINKISRIGQGPGEYIAITDITIKDNEEIIIWDIKSKKLLIYNFDGTFINNIEFPYWGRSIEYLGDDFLAMYCDYSSNPLFFEGKTSPNLVIFNLKTREAKHSLFFDKDINTQGITIISNNLSLFRGQALLLPTLSNSIYNISKEGEEERYYLDFGMPFQKKISDYIEKTLPDISVYDIRTAEANSNLPFIKNILSSDDLIFFTYLFGSSFYYGFYYPESNTFLEASAVIQENRPIELIENDIDNTMSYWPRFIDAKNNFYCVLQPYLLHDRFKDSENEILRNLIRNSKPDDNPIIVKAFMKVL